METETLSSSLLQLHPFSRHQKVSHNRRRRNSLKIFASGKEANDQNFHGRIVDENMIVLRKRIHEMKMVERNYEPPAHWMEWEKRCYTSYDSLICEAMGFLQSQFMNTRPSMALGIVSLVALSVPTSTALLALQLLEVIKIFLSANRIA